MTTKAPRRRRLRRLTSWLGACLLLVVVGWVVLLVLAGSPTLGPQRDYLVALNERVDGIAPDQQAWPALQDSVAGLECPSDRGFGDFLAEELHALEAEEQDRWLEARAPTLESIREALRRPHLGLPHSFQLPDPVDHPLLLSQNERAALDLVDPARSQPPAMAGGLLMELPVRHPSAFRAIAQLLEADAHAAIRTGAFTRAIDDCLALLDLARLSSQDPMLIAQLSGLALHGLAEDTILDLLGRVGEDLELSALDRLAAALDQTLPPVSFDGERMILEDIVQRVYSNDEEGNGVLMVSQAGGPFGAMNQGMPGMLGQANRPSGVGQLITQLFFQPLAVRFLGTRQDVLELHKAMASEALELMESDPSSTDWTTLDALEASITSSGGPFRQLHLFPLSIVAPAMDRIVLAYQYRAFMHQLTRTVVALNQYRAIHGSWPAGLEELEPELLERLPRDPFDGALVRYALRAGRPILWSIGPDKVDQTGVFGDSQGRLSLRRVHRRVDQVDVQLWPLPEQPDGD